MPKFKHLQGQLKVVYADVTGTLHKNDKIMTNLLFLRSYDQLIVHENLCSIHSKNASLKISSKYVKK